MTISERLSPYIEKYKDFLIPLFTFIMTRTFITLGGYISRVLLLEKTGMGPWQLHPEIVFIDILNRWDSAFYLEIAQIGYVFDPQVQYHSQAFFPLYPLLIALFKIGIGDPGLSGIVVSHLCLLGALIFLYKLAQFEFKCPATAQRTILYLSIFPTAFFLGATYSESTFLLFTIASFYFARRRQWLGAGLTGMLASATRVIGVILYGIVLLEWFNDRGITFQNFYRLSSWAPFLSRLKQDKPWGQLLAIHLIPLGLLAYMLFLYLTFGNPLLFFSVQADWGKGGLRFPMAGLLGGFVAIFRHGQDLLKGDVYMCRVSIDVLSGMMALGMVPWIWKKIGPTYALYTFACILIPTTASSIQSLSRYTISAFPIFMLLALWGRSRWIDQSITVGSAILVAVFFAIFANWLFIA